MPGFDLSNLQEKAGPLPEWAWIALIGVGGYLIIAKRKKGAGTPTQTPVGNTGSASTIDPLTGIAYANEANGFQGALLTAQYDQLNSEGMLNSNLGILNSGINAQTGATGANTAALGTNTAAVSSNSTAVNSNTAASASNTAAVAGNTGATNTNTQAIQAAPVVAAPAPVAAPPAPSPVAHNQHIYTVVRGDTLSGIANKIAKLWGVQESWQSIYAANKGVIGGNPGMIYPGQQFLVGS